MQLASNGSNKLTEPFYSMLAP
eukprot:CCRYP_014362-RD/>CCRYP_014362-RD protein AED:0.49 eAED:0.49 QI:0/-1/0/1/-1/0/1/0/21